MINLRYKNDNQLQFIMDNYTKRIPKKIVSPALLSHTASAIISTTFSKTSTINLISIFGISIIIALGTMTYAFTTSSFPNTAWAQQNVISTSIQPQSSTNSSNANPTEGYGSPQGHLTAIRHVFDDPSLRVQHYCKPNDKIMLVCQLYDSKSPNATLIGIEYIISSDQYKTLPDREKPSWHYHQIEFATNRADAHFPDLTPQKEGELLKKLADTYGKVIITWNPQDKLPAFPPQVEEVQHPFMVNSTAVPNTNTGSFNQTLEY